jgi:alkaline phosphatase D
MQPTRASRRQFLTLASGGLAAAGLVACGAEPVDSGDPAPDAAPERPPEPAAWTAPGQQDDAAFACGVQSGDVTSNGARLSVWTTQADLTLRVVRAEGTGWVEHLTRTGLRPDEAGHLALTLDGLSPDTAYAWCATTADGATCSPVGRIRTALAATSPRRRISFGATSCLRGEDTPWPSLTFAAAENLDFFCLLGDTVYADGAEDLDGYRAYWRTALATSGLRRVTASTSIVATWDDHEVGNNWSLETVSPERVDAARQAYREGLPQGTGPDGASIWRSLAWGDVLELIVLDSRGERRDGRYMSAAQMTWIKDTLLASKARFKFVLNSVPITDLWAFFQDLQAQDRWQGHPEERTELLAHIVEHDIRGVVFVAGDLHYGQVGWVDPAGGLAAHVPEVLVGPGGSLVNLVAAIYPGNAQYPAVVPAWNWCRFDVDPELGTVRVRHIGDDGVALSDMVLTP